MKTLNKIEKDIVDHYFLKNNISELNLVWFNHAIANTLPTWRCEQMVDTNDTLEPTQAFIDYKKDLLQK